MRCFVATRIRILPEQLANKIAAGEVVERPAAVVKELVENSLDAGAQEISVEIESGGKKSIRVSDDGCGLSREEALLALERHATSKLSSDADLAAIATLGFRGEALPSIASVSRLTLASRERESVEGTEIYVEGGKIVSVKAHGMAAGTAIEVRNLFFNTPARLKFMRSAETEAGHVGELLTRLALSRPDVRMTYISDRRSQFRVLQGNLTDRIASLLGSDVSQGLWPLDVTEGSITVRGFISRPALSRSTTTNLYTYINGRFIRDRVVQHAILQAYRGVLERGRYPVVVLFMDIPPEEVDVNVHPTKHEVRFREQGRVHDVIQAAVENLLRTSPWTVRAAAAPVTVASADRQLREVRDTGVREALARYAAQPAREQPSVFPMPPATSSRSFSSSVAQAAAPEGMAGLPDYGGGYYSSLTVLGQFNAMYILCQDGTDLVLIDQHAAHERIAFQQLKSQFGQTGVEVQGLLFPETIELTFAESACVKEFADTLEKLGFELEAFGGTTSVIKGVPRMFAHLDYQRVLRDIVAELLQIGRSHAAVELADDLMACMACHSVVRGSRSLSVEEIRSLLRQMDQAEFAATCPHGRPVLCRFPLGDIERMFKRSKSGNP